MATMQPPSPDARVPRSSPGTKGQVPPKAVASVRSSKGRAASAVPPQAEVPSNEFVDRIASRNTPGFKPKKAG